MMQLTGNLLLDERRDVRFWPRADVPFADGHVSFWPLADDREVSGERLLLTHFGRGVGRRLLSEERTRRTLVLGHP